MDSKKAGIIVGVVIIVIALVIAIIFGGKSKDSNAKATEAKEVQTTTVATKPKESKPQEDNNSKNEQQSATSTQGAVQIDEESLNGLSQKEHSEVAYISRKNIYLQGKQLYYTVDVLLGDNTTVTYYTSETGYNLLEVNDKIKIDYIVYTNDSGISFIQVTSVTTVQ